MIAFVIILSVAVYFFPWIIAASRNHHQRSSIIVLNLLLGWTFLGWVIALVWAAGEVKPIVNDSGISLTEELLNLSELKDKGILTQEEFDQKKEKIIQKM